jgi:LmbE family N-acetylglucosaminyl deacetylase
MARHADEGDSVSVLILFGDGTGRDAARRRNAERAAAILGALPPRFSGLPENRGDTLPMLEVVSIIERCSEELRPEVVYVCHGGNLNVDHQVTFRSALTALRPLPTSSVKAIYTYEILSSTDWAPVTERFAFQPNRFVSITKQLSRKAQALEAYQDEMRPVPHSRSHSGALHLAALRGGTAGLEAAEAFCVVREIVGR